MDSLDVAALVYGSSGGSKSCRNSEEGAHQTGEWVRFLGLSAQAGRPRIISESAVRPDLVRLCNKLIVTAVPHHTWTAVRLACNAWASNDREAHHEHGSEQVVIALSKFEGGRVIVDGILQDSSGRACVLFDPCLSHSVEAVQGIRLVLVAFTQRQSLLSSLGFRTKSRCNIKDPQIQGCLMKLNRFRWRLIHCWSLS